MNNLISNFLSWTFVAGVVVGFCLERACLVIYTAWLNRHRPLPGGARRACTVAVDPQRFAAAIMVFFVGWSIAVTQASSDQATKITGEARVFAEETRECQRVLVQAIIDRAAITADNDRESRIQRDALADWLRSLLDPPPAIAALPGDDPVRQQYAIDTTVAHYAIVQASQREQGRNDEERRHHPLPAPDCPRR